MTAGEERQVERLRPTPMLIAAGAVLVVSTGLFAVNSAAQRSLAVWGWAPVVAGAAFTAWLFWRTAVTPGLDAVARRVWRSLAVVAVLVLLGLAGDTWATFQNPVR